MASTYMDDTNRLRSCGVLDRLGRFAEQDPE